MVSRVGSIEGPNTKPIFVEDNPALNVPDGEDPDQEGNPLPSVNDPGYSKDLPVPDELSVAHQGAVEHVMLDSNLSMAEVFQKVQEAYQKMASSVKEMATQLSEEAINLRSEVYKKQLSAAKQERNISLGKTITSAVLGVGASSFASAGSKLIGKVKPSLTQEAKWEKSFMEKHGAEAKYVQDKERLAADAKAHVQDSAEAISQHRMQKQQGITSLIQQNSAGVSDSLFSGSMYEVTAKRSQADFQRGVQDQFTKNSDRFESEYQEYRRKALESLNMLVQLHGQAQQVASWRG